MHTPFRSKLPDVGTTIFTVISRRAAELGALNLGQGFPDYDMDPRLAELIYQAMHEGHNQYAPMEGAIVKEPDKLRIAIVKRSAFPGGTTTPHFFSATRSPKAVCGDVTAISGRPQAI